MGDTLLNRAPQRLIIVHNTHSFLLLNVQLITVGVSYQVPIFIPKKILQLLPELGGEGRGGEGGHT